MNAHTASFNTGGALGFQGTLSAHLFGEMDYTARNKGHFLLGGTLDDLSFPVQNESLLVKTVAVANWPGFAIDFQFVAALTNQMATQISPINMQFLQGSRLLSQIFADRFGDTGFRRIRRSDSYCSDEAGIQIVEHMPLVSIDAHTATFAAMTHFG